MQESSRYWDNWARLLHNLGVKRLAVSVLEGAGGLRFLAAQIVHLTSPFLTSSQAYDQWQALASLLEDSDRSRQFISFLQKEEED
jgi:hypothetical protein